MYRIVYTGFRCLLFCTACAFAAASCRKLIEVPPPENKLETAAVFSNDQNATDAIRGLYIKIMSSPRSLLDGGASVYNSLSADDLYRPIPLASEDAFIQNALNSQSSACYTLYSQAYAEIYQANLIREQVAASAGVSPSVKQQLTGEADFMRALLYFYLVNLFGDVPLVTGTDYTVNAIMPRTPVATVYQQITADLKEAQRLLPSSYVTTMADPTDRTRPNRAAATALLARVYLFQKNWPEAEQQASDVINDSADYRMETDLNKVFLSTSREAVWQLQPVNGNYTQEGMLFVPSTVPPVLPTYALTGFLKNAFEPGDQRLTTWTAQKIVNATAYRYPYKYKVGAVPSLSKEYNTVLRLAEQYLIRSEARAWQGNISGAAADLDSVRHRAGLPPFTAIDQGTLLTAIYHERQVEFFAEWGLRWLDLHRNGQADAILGVEKPGWKTQAILYPIPITEIEHNSYLTQNSGY
jgi:starch-binding outer membrane protein, SusD/RagB family